MTNMERTQRITLMPYCLTTSSFSHPIQLSHCSVVGTERHVMFGHLSLYGCFSHICIIIIDHRYDVMICPCRRSLTYRRMILWAENLELSFDI
jgi:hypothetical protein